MKTIRCSLRTCGNKSSSKGGKFFYKFPSIKPVRQNWIKYTNRGPSWQPSPNSRLCQDHFDDSQYKILIDGSKILHLHACPNIGQIPTSVHHFYPEQSIMIGSALTAKVCHIDTLSKIFIYKPSNIAELEEMQNEIQEIAEFQYSLKSFNLKFKEAFLLKHPTSGKWFRAQVISEHEDNRKVRCVDYGFEFFLSQVTELKEMPKEYVQLPPQAICCSLHGWDQQKKNVKMEKASFPFGKIFQVQIVSLEDCQTPCYGAIFKNENECLNTKFGALASELQSPCSTVYQLDDAPQSEVCISHFKDPNNFFINIVCLNDRMAAATSNHNHLMKFKLEASFVKPGLLVMASLDNQLQRALVLMKKDDLVIVSFLDFGMEKEVPVSKLHPMPADLMRFPMFAVKCSLYDVKPVHGQHWSICKKYQDIFDSTKTFHVNIIEKLENKWCVDLCENGLSLSKLLVIADLASFCQSSKRSYVDIDASDEELLTESHLIESHPELHCNIASSLSQIDPNAKLQEELKRRNLEIKVDPISKLQKELKRKISEIKEKDLRDNANLEQELKRQNLEIKTLEEKLKVADLRYQTIKRNLSKFLNADQIRCIECTVNVKEWSDETIQVSSQTRVMCGEKGYEFLRKRGWPLPSSSTMCRLKKRTKKQKITTMPNPKIISPKMPKFKKSKCASKSVESVDNMIKKQKEVLKTNEPVPKKSDSSRSVIPKTGNTVAEFLPNCKLERNSQSDDLKSEILFDNIDSSSDSSESKWLSILSS